jgi:cytochrome bd-type quinol oxidase subunit 1
MTAELGRQPWLIYHLMRTANGTSHRVHGGSTVFTLVGFTGLYFVLGLLVRVPHRARGEPRAARARGGR